MKLSHIFGRSGHFFAGAAVASITAVLNLVDPGQAAPVTFVSGNGNNSNNCLTPATACRQIGGSTGADSKTDSGGTIHVLPGAYQPFQLFTKSINILADPGQATISGSADAGGTSPVGPAAITVFQSAIVRIRGFAFTSDASGVGIYGNAVVHLENCTFKAAAGIGNAGVELTSGEVYISNSAFHGSGQGILIKPPAGGSARVAVNNVNIENVGIGLSADFRGTNTINRIAVRDTMIANGTRGFLILEDASGSTSVVGENVNLSNSTSQAILANGATIVVRMRDSVISGNAVGISAVAGAQVVSHGDNVLIGNVNDGAFTSTVAPQ